MNHSQSSLFSGISYSYITFIDEYLKLLNNTLYTSFEYLDSDVHHIIEEMHTLFTSLPNLLTSEEEFKEAYAHKLIEFRNVLEKKYRSLNAYKRELGHLTSVYNLKSGLNQDDLIEAGLDDSDENDIDFESLAKDCTQFVFSDQTKLGRQQKASSLLPFIPMRMTKDSFLAYIERSISQISLSDDPSSLTFLTSILFQFLDGHLYDGFGKDFTDISISLDELTICKDEDDFFESSELLGETLDTCLKAINNLYKMICTFSNLLIFDSVSFEILCDLHISFYDLYCTLEKIIKGEEDADLFLTTLPERVDEIKTELQKSYTKACQSKDIDPLFTLIQTYLSMDLSYVFGFDTTTHPLHSLEQKSILKDFLAQLRESLSALHPGERKLRMQYFISMVPFMMSETVFHDYVIHGFSNTSHPKRNLITALYLSQALEENGYFETPENSEFDAYPSDDYEHDHTDHGHDDCDCNHDHDDCDCDHDHDEHPNLF